MVPGSTSSAGRSATSPFAWECAVSTTTPSSARRQMTWVPTSASGSKPGITASSCPYVPRSSVSRSAGARAPGCWSAATTVATTSSSATLDQRQSGADAEEDEARDAWPADRDAVEPEPAVAVDRRRHHEVERDDRSDCGREPDARRRDGDREDDQHRQRPSGPQPEWLPGDVAQAAEAPGHDQQQGEPEHHRDHSREG